MSKTNNFVTKPYLKKELERTKTDIRTEMRGMEKRIKKELRDEIKASAESTKKDLRIEMRGIAAHLTHDITTDIKEQMRQDKADILGAVADFGKRVQNFEEGQKILNQRLSDHIHHHAPASP